MAGNCPAPSMNQKQNPRGGGGSGTMFMFFGRDGRMRRGPGSRFENPREGVGVGVKNPGVAFGATYPSKGGVSTLLRLISSSEDGVGVDGEPSCLERG